MVTKGVYCLTSPNGKRYVGYGTSDGGVQRRWGKYRRYDCRDQPHLYNALKFHGSENFKYELVFETDDEDTAKRVEIQLIALWNLKCDKFGYNLTDGGDGCKGYKASNETKNKQRKAKLGVRRSQESVDKSAETHRKLYREGKISNPMLGKTHSEEAKKKASDSMKLYLLNNPRKPMSEETRKKISDTKLKR